MNDRVRNNIRQLRYERERMTQQALATKTGVSRQTIIAIESGKYTPSLPLALKLSAVFGLKVEEIFQLEAPS